MPAIRQVLPADLAPWHWPPARRHALASRQRSSLLSANGQSRFPRQQDYSGRGGYPSKPWPRDLELAFEPDQNIHGRTRRYTSARRLNRPVMIARSWRNRDGGRAKVQAIFARAWLFTRTRAWREFAEGRHLADDATNKFNQCVLRLVSFNWMSI